MINNALAMGGGDDDDDDAEEALEDELVDRGNLTEDEADRIEGCVDG